MKTHCGFGGKIILCLHSSRIIVKFQTIVYKLECGETLKTRERSFIMIKSKSMPSLITLSKLLVGISVQISPIVRGTQKSQVLLDN